MSQPKQPPSENVKSPHKVYTYHCVCKNLLFATTYHLPSLPRRASPSLDKAYILPKEYVSKSTVERLVRPKKKRAGNLTEDISTEDISSDEESIYDYNGEPNEKPPADRGSTVLLNMPIVKDPEIVEREDGYEKRWWRECTRCAVRVGYQLDWRQWLEDSNISENQKKEWNRKIEKRGRRGDVVYILPGGIQDTEDKNLTEGDVGFGVGDDAS